MKECGNDDTIWSTLSAVLGNTKLPLMLAPPKELITHVVYSWLTCSRCGVPMSGSCMTCGCHTQLSSSSLKAVTLRLGYRGEPKGESHHSWAVDARNKSHLGAHLTLWEHEVQHCQARAARGPDPYCCAVCTNSPRPMHISA